jgi:hypothetical protein
MTTCAKPHTSGQSKSAIAESLPERVEDLDVLGALVELLMLRCQRAGMFVDRRDGVHGLRPMRALSVSRIVNGEVSAAASVACTSVSNAARR